MITLIVGGNVAKENLSEEWYLNRSEMWDWFDIFYVRYGNVVRIQSAIDLRYFESAA